MDSTADPVQPRLQLDFIDGLRAVAALAVTVLHAFAFTGLSGQAARDGHQRRAIDGRATAERAATGS